MKANTIHELAHAIFSPLFATRDSAQVAYDELMKEVSLSNNPSGLSVAVHVLLNSLADEIERVTALEALKDFPG